MDPAPHCIHYRTLRTSQAGQLLLNLSFALLGIYVMFIISLHATKPEPLCAVAGGFLHYFMLVTFLSMAAEAVNLYLKLVIVLGIPEFLKNRYVLKVALIAWSKLLHTASIFVSRLEYAMHLTQLKLAIPTKCLHMDPIMT